MFLFFLQTSWNDGTMLASLVEALGGKVPGWPDVIDRTDHVNVIQKGMPSVARDTFMDSRNLYRTPNLLIPMVSLWYESLYYRWPDIQITLNSHISHCFESVSFLNRWFMCFLKVNWSLLYNVKFLWLETGLLYMLIFCDVAVFPGF